MPSFDAVNYSLRPSKSIQRQIVFSGVGLLRAQLAMEGMIYIGMGSVWFVDFSLAHRLLGIDDMVSIEADEIGCARARFNAPYATVKVEEGHSLDVLRKLAGREEMRNRPWMVWLDYDYELNESVREDVLFVIEHSPANSVLIITFNGVDRKYGAANDRVERLRSVLGDVVPDTLDKAACKDTEMQNTLATLTLDYMKSSAEIMARPGGFVPAFKVLYRDNAPMITVGGVLPSKGAASIARDMVAHADWPCLVADRVHVPHLTLREAASLQARLPRAMPLSRSDIQNLGFDLPDEQIAAFERHYKLYPSFAQVAL